MPVQQVNLSEQQAEFVRLNVESGAFKNADEVMRAAFDALEREAADERRKRDGLRAAIDVGVAELDRGEGVTIPAGEIGSFVRRRAERLIAETRR